MPLPKTDDNGPNLLPETPSTPTKSFIPNLGLYTNGKHELYLSESRGLAPQEHECIVHIRCSGICGYCFPRLVRTIMRLCQHLQIRRPLLE